MNLFDLIVYLSVALSLFVGWRRGFVWQVVQLAVLLVAFYTSTFFSGEIGLMLGMQYDMAHVAGFIVIFFVAIVATFVIGYITRSMFQAVGLRLVDSMLGMVLGAVKTLLLLGILFSWFEPFNTIFGWVPQDHLYESQTFRPLTEFIEYLTPYFHDLQDSIIKYNS